MTLTEGLTRARHEARKLQQRYGMLDVVHVDVMALAESLALNVVLNASLAGADAQLLGTQGRSRIFVSERLVNPAAQRVAVAHELGHHVLNHPPESLTNLCRPMGRPKPRPLPVSSCSQLVGRDLECEAHAFALELLTPEGTVENVCRRRDPDVALCADLARLALVPLEYAAMRIAETSRHACAAVLSSRGRIVWVATSPWFKFLFQEPLQGKLATGAMLDARTLTWRAARHLMASRGEHVAANAWIGMADLPLFETTIPTGTDGEIVTMLWAANFETVDFERRMGRRAAVARDAEPSVVRPRQLQRVDEHDRDEDEHRQREAHVAAHASSAPLG